MIKVNIYYEEKLADTFNVLPGSNVNSIDDARYIVVSHLDKFYSDVKYKLNLFKPYNGHSEINLYFDNNIGLSREIKLRKILKND